MPDVDEELEEIKRLIATNSEDYKPPSKELVPLRPRTDMPALPKQPEKKELVVRQKPQSPTVVPPRPAPAVKKPPQRVPTRSPQQGLPPGAGGVQSYDISPDGRISRKAGKEPEPDIGTDDFEMDFDFEGEYRDIPENRPLRLRRERRTGCVGGFLYAAFVICISLVFASLMWMATVDVLGFGAEDELINVTVPAEFTMEAITDMLHDAGLIRYKFLFNIYADYSNAEEKITSGHYVLNRNLDYRSIVQGMTARAGVRVETTVTIPEGYTLAQIFTLLEDYGVCTAEKLWEAATNHNFNYHFLDEETLGERYRLEGFLFPETHNFFMDSTPERVLNTLLREFNRRFTDTFIERAEQMGYSIHDIINVASIIEREAGSDEERPRIAAVIYNRLESRNFPHLQIDATIHYAIAGTGRPFSTEIDHPYNTYVIEGLPPGPISNPGMDSIRAALYPDSTNEFYYALNREGTHNFFRTYDQHRAFVNSPQYGGR